MPGLEEILNKVLGNTPRQEDEPALGKQGSDETEEITVDQFCNLLHKQASELVKIAEVLENELGTTQDEEALGKILSQFESGGGERRDIHNIYRRQVGRLVGDEGEEIPSVESLLRGLV
jgi:hypothetical protein